MGTNRKSVPDRRCAASEAAAYQSLLMQNHRLRVQLYLERKGISTINPPTQALQYIADAFKAGLTPDIAVEWLEAMFPVWNKERENAARKTPRLSVVQSD